jgi:hypothetical protein
MAFQFSTASVNAALDAIEAAIGAGAVLKIRTGAVPATVATPDAGAVLATLTLPSDWLEPASNRSKVKAGTWQDTSADAAGSAAHFRVYASDGATAHIQGSITATGGGGDMTLDNIVIASGQTVTITAFTLNGPPA